MATNNYLKTRKLMLNKTLTEQEQATLMQSIQNAIGIVHCALKDNCLTISYDLQLTSLKKLLPNIEVILKKFDIQLTNNTANSVKTQLIHFMEENQRDNINKPSQWHFRLQDMYLNTAHSNAKNHRTKRPHKAIMQKSKSKVV